MVRYWRPLVALAGLVVVLVSLCHHASQAQAPGAPFPRPTAMGPGTGSWDPEPVPTPQTVNQEQAPPAAPVVEGRGIWIEMKTLPPTADKIRAVVRSLARCHFNLLLVEVTYEGASLYPSRFTTQDSRFAGLDPLAVIVDEAHKHKMEVHAWMWVYKQSRYRSGEARPGGPVLAAHPEWTALNQDGKPVAAGACYYWLCPSKPAVKAFLLGWMEELVTRYRLDGLHFDYVRYDKILAKSGFPAYCFCPDCREAYRRLRGTDPVTFRPYTAAFRDWEGWRESLIDDLVADAAGRLRALRPNLLLSAAVYPDAQAARRYFGQNWAYWVRNNWMDFVCPMAYQDQTDSFLRRLQRYIADGTARQTVVLPGVGVNEVRKKRIFSHDVLIEQVQAVRQAGMMGNVIFSYSVMTAPLEQFLIDRVYPNVAALPFRDPVLAGSRLRGQASQLMAAIAAASDASRQANWLLARAGDLQTITAYRSRGQVLLPPDPPPLEPPAIYRGTPSAEPGRISEADAPRVDGVLSDDAWKGIPAVILSCDQNGGVARLKSWARMATDGTRLYVAVHCDEPEMSTRSVLQRKLRRRHEEDHVAVYLDPGPSRSQYLVLRTNLMAGQSFEKVPSPLHRPPGVECPENVPDELRFPAAVRRGKDGWNVEMAIPLEQVVARSADYATSRRLGINVVRARNERGRMNYSEWSCTYGQPYNPLRFGVLQMPR